MADGMINRAHFAKSEAGTPTPLLAFLAGPHAPAIAAVWPAPHKEFFALPAARRHAAAILLARGETDAPRLRHLVTHARDSVLAGCLMDPPQSGLMKAMARLGETAWKAADFELFLDLFAEDGAARVIRHLADVRPGKLHLIHALPGVLREAVIVEKVPRLDAARDLARAFALAGRIHGGGELRRIAARWLRAKDTRKLFAMATESLEGVRFAGPSPVPALPAPFVAVTERRQLGEVALQFKNCLRDFADELVIGRMAVFVWTAQPDVALALRWDPAGWRLAEAETAANGEVEEPQLRELVHILGGYGVRTGPSTWTLARRLNRHPFGDAGELGETWVDRLELGELWD